jgi:hypothetical protein
MITHSAPEDKLAVTVLAVRPVSRGNLHGFADIRVGELTIRDLRIIQQPNQRPWVSPPQKEWLTPDGQRHYTPLLEFGPALKVTIEAAVLQARREAKTHG